MKIEKIEIKNVLGLSGFSINTLAPLQLVAGLNGQGKSSIQNAVRMALTSVPSRVFLKKHYSQLVHDGKKKGNITVTYDNGMTAGVDLPKGAIISVDDENLPYVLEPKLLSSLKPKDLKTFLYKLSKVKIKPEEVREALRAKVRASTCRPNTPALA